MTLTKLLNTLKTLCLVFPMPDKVKVKLYYSIFTPFFETISEGSGILNYGQEKLCKDTANSIPKHGKWLDVGCGLGGPARYLANEYKEIDITGINISQLQIKEGVKRTENAKLADRVHIQYGDACSMPFKENDIFDGVYAIETAFHYPDKFAFLEESKRVLKSGGRFAIADMVNVENDLSSENTFKTKIFHTWLGIMNMMKVSEWEKSLSNAGFTDIQIEDVTNWVLVEGLTKANKQIKKFENALLKDYPGFLIKAVKWGNDWTISKIDNKPIRYVIITANAT